ncbi:hypothetical protein GUJ93_ZPchr0006g44019 [Zizania palustris]|uniref:Uncharacterized protein n=1 Tax=Zizania palustris TaxID=103762 RepID=A0A8J5W1L2_ZIZPA|nr:hypothetical protein GUJ93_ZPchr0006g44019 [Zizania palustris]
MEGGEQEESSSKRRERLLALRSSAAAASSLSSAPSPRPPPAAEPDLPELDLADAAAPPPPQRFDYYTNPGAAFAPSSAALHKRKVADSPAPAPPYGNYGRGYPPNQHHMAPSPIHSPSPTPYDSPSSSPWRSPMQFQNPMPGYRGPPLGAPPHWSPHSASPAQGPYPHSPNFPYRNSNPGQSGSSMNYGPRGNPHSSYGRGRGQNQYISPGSRGRGGRGGFGFQNYSGWQDRRSYYNKSMIDDPWQDLQPVVGNILIPRDGSKPWLPASLRAKKDTPDQGQIKSKSGLSLAEYLDLSFNEASNDT